MFEGLTFDDVSLVPQFSNIASRHDVSLKDTFFGFNLKTPIISANMATVTGWEMAKAMRAAGGVGAMHRFQPLEKFAETALHDKFRDMIVSVGVDDYVDRLATYHRYGFWHVCIDVAHGHHQKVGNVIKYIRDTYGSELMVIAGNICTARGARYLVDCGADVVKVGVGPGSHCTTRVVTGHGVPQIDAIWQVAEELRNDTSVDIIADGGIRNSGDIAKALAAGADYVMIGRLFAGCAEAPSEAVLKNGRLVKVYRGSASYEAQSKHRDKRTIIAEGVQSDVPYTGTVEQVLAKLSLGLKSACSYTGADTLQKFKALAELMRVSTSSYLEGTPHGA